MAVDKSHRPIGRPKGVPVDTSHMKALRSAKQWTQEMLAEKAGYSVTTIQSMERGETKSDATIHDVAIALGTTFDALALRDSVEASGGDVQAELNAFLERLGIQFEAKQVPGTDKITYYFAVTGSVVGILLVFIGTLPVNAQPFNAAALLLSLISLGLMIKAGRSYALPSMACVLSLAAIVAWPYTFGFFQTPAGLSLNVGVRYEFVPYTNNRHYGDLVIRRTPSNSVERHHEPVAIRFTGDGVSMVHSSMDGNPPFNMAPYPFPAGTRLRCTWEQGMEPIESIDVVIRPREQGDTLCEFSRELPPPSTATFLQISIDPGWHKGSVDGEVFIDGQFVGKTEGLHTIFKSSPGRREVVVHVNGEEFKQVLTLRRVNELPHEKDSNTAFINVSEAFPDGQRPSIARVR